MSNILKDPLIFGLKLLLKRERAHSFLNKLKKHTDIHF